ncbi:DUF1128 domain-containing protein [Ammoniphilus resinae]|uniref:UPF0435 protein J2Z37_003946 n=1 Tax=Ammoniphilus resinae TaxID=861532 RepID=A0ABS4GUI8_9BACL|nr:DUF1128 domain-containing protein [Ammoniphilus resinae]MBP1933929.1 uncharacterized protein YfkK (UPF0435 family) [Ammoniphilus resinae]
MNLENPSRENIAFIMDGIKKKLTMVNTSVMNPDSFELEVYEDLLYLYQMISKKDRFSISEMEAIVTELGSMRKK